MAQEIRHETNWLGEEIDVIIEDGVKVGETRQETTWLGESKGVTRDNNGNKVSETRQETTWLGESREVTRDNSGNRISETTYETGIFGGKTGVIREDGKEIGRLTSEQGIFGGRRQVLHESGEDVDLTRRVTREKSTSSSESSYGGGGDGDWGGSGDASKARVNASTRSKAEDESDEIMFGLLKLLGFAGLVAASIVALGIYGYNSFKNSNESTSPSQATSITREYDKSRSLEERTISAEENVRRLLQYVERNYQLGDLNNYQITLPPKMILKEHREIALFNDYAFYVFHSSDNGKTWIPLPPTDPVLIKLNNKYVERFQNR